MIFSRYRNLLFSVVIPLLLFGYCTEKRNETAASIIHEIADSILVIPVDKKTNYLALNSTVYNDGVNTYLVRVNELTNHLQFYKNTTLDFQIAFDATGPNGIGQLRAAYVISMDSIIVLPRFANRIYIGNSKGEIYKRIDLSPIEMEGGTYGFILAFSSAPLVKVGNKLYTKVSQFYDFCDPKNNFKASSRIAEIDLEKEVIRNIISTPEEYQDKSWTGEHYYYISHTYDDKNKLLHISFPASPYIYSYHIEEKTLIKKYLGTKNITKINFFSYDQCTNLDEWQKANESLKFSFYGFCAYATKPGLLYRFYHLPTDEKLKIKNEDNNPDSRLSAHRTGLIVVDNELNIIADIILPDYEFNTYDFFVTDEGLWLSHHNYFNKRQNENTMKFSLLKFEK